MLSEDKVVDVVVIGGGPGGYTAAERAAQLEGKVVLVEKDLLGGNCLNRGCIPALAFLRSAMIFHQARMAKQFGVLIDGTSINYKTLAKRKDELVGSLVAGTERRLKSGGVEVIKGTGTLAACDLVSILKDNGQSETFRTKNIIIATGSNPLDSDISGANNKGILLADQAFSLKRLPQSMAVVGCDYIGVQLACVFSQLGTNVTVIEVGPQFLPEEDEEISAILQDLFLAYGMSIVTEAKVVAIANEKKGDKMLSLATKDGIRSISVEEVILSKGRKPNTGGLGLEKLNVATNRSGGIVVDRHMRTNIPEIYAIGDATGRYMLAQVAMAEGNIAAENAMGRDSSIDYKVVPRCIFTIPEVATVGLTEKQAKEQGYRIKVSRLPLEFNSYAHIIGQTEGLVKIIADAQFGEILGMHIIGPQASNLIHEVALAIQLEATIEDIARMIRVHPSLAEAIKETAWRLYGWVF